MSLHITVRDEQTGDVEEVRVPDGEYWVVATKPCHVAHAQAHANGTHILTIKGRAPRPLPPVVDAEILCCDMHVVDGDCCDPDDCGPCCEYCPTCPTLARGREVAP